MLLGPTRAPVTHESPGDLAAAMSEAITTACDPASVAEAGRLIRPAMAELVGTGMDAVELAGFVSDAIDAMTRRLIALTITELGEPPVPWAWLALGSAARREQGLGTDQDHALAYEPQGQPLNALDPYFHRFAEDVTSGLERAGIPRCNADVVAVNHALRRPVEHWVEAFQTWMADPRVEAVRQTTILFDHRRVAGPLEVERTLRKTIASSPDRSAFVGRLITMAMRARPRRHLRAPRRIDLKHHGLMQIASLARILAIEGDVPRTGTLERLSGAAGLGLIHEGSFQRLAAAFRLMWRVRVEHQLAAADAGRGSGDRIHIRGHGIRTEIGDALGAILEAQDALAARAAVGQASGDRAPTDIALARSATAVR